MQAFICRHGWRNEVAGETLPELSAPARDFAILNIARMHRKIAKRSKKFDELSPHLRHELRKDLKKLRYAADLFSALFERQGQIQNYIRIIAKLQNQLGLFNDLIAAQQLAGRLNTDPTPETARATGIIIGWCGRGAATDDDELKKAWKKFRDVKSFA
jgi:CHAD domain-containing protein